MSFALGWVVGKLNFSSRAEPWAKLAATADGDSACAWSCGKCPASPIWTQLLGARGKRPARCSNSHFGSVTPAPGEGTRPTPPQNRPLVGRVPSPGVPIWSIMRIAGQGVAATCGALNLESLVRSARAKGRRAARLGDSPVPPARDPARFPRNSTPAASLARSPPCGGYRTSR
jgi:hypothetical protein